MQCTRVHIKHIALIRQWQKYDFRENMIQENDIIDIQKIKQKLLEYRTEHNNLKTLKVNYYDSSIQIYGRVIIM